MSLIVPANLRNVNGAWYTLVYNFLVKLTAAVNGASSPSKLNKSMAALTTTGDDQLACATPIGATPKGFVLVGINGILYNPGDATKTGVPCYFSGDGGTTPRAQGGIQAGDLLYWVGSVALFQLNGTVPPFDGVSYYFNA